MQYLTCHGLYAKRKIGHPSLILFDLKLPHLDGIEVLKQVRSNPALSGIPIFILSAAASYEYIHRSNLLWISKYIVKPLNAGNFMSDIHGSSTSKLRRLDEAHPAFPN
ncbi:response regulator [Noviherbaspirillum sp. Root189]|uniref:response regulator n=1 Tax=Noviherbaspirillum sp. Root189 TaxID=1736487 RepID=UPI003FA59A6E